MKERPKLMLWQMSKFATVWAPVVKPKNLTTTEMIDNQEQWTFILASTTYQIVLRFDILNLVYVKQYPAL